MATKSKWFRVAVEGATTDGRELTRQDIADMAATYNRETYGARVNMEHYRGFVAGGPFDMLGDVLALKTQEDELKIGDKNEKRLCLYAEIEPLDNLIALNQAGQKIFTSIEIQPDFAKTGKAGLVGLAVTDSPASLGTSVLQFSSKNPDFFAGRKQTKGNLFTEAQETTIEFIDMEDEPADSSAGAFASMRKFFDTMTGKVAAPAVEQPKAPVEPAVAVSGKPETDFAAFLTGFKSFSDGLEQSLTALTAAQKKQSADLAALTQRLDQEPDTRRYSARPAVSGGNARPRGEY